MSVNSLDLLQFHWWDYNNPYYMDALKYLSDLGIKEDKQYLEKLKEEEVSIDWVHRVLIVCFHTWLTF